MFCTMRACLLYLAAGAFVCAAAPLTSGCRSGSRSRDVADVDRVCDPDSLLATRDLLDVQRAIVALESGTPHTCGRKSVGGYQVAIKLLDHLPLVSDADSSTHANKAMRLAKSAHDEWGVGHADCEDGIVLLLAIRQRQMYMSQGAGTLAIVNDDTRNAILHRMKPHLRSGDVHSAVVGAVYDMHAVLAPTDEAFASLRADLSTFIAAESSARRWALFQSILVLVLVLGVFGFAAYSVLKEHRASAARAEAARAEERDWAAVRARLQQLEAARQAADRDGDPLAAHITSCPICLDDFPATVDAAHPVLTLQCRHRFHSSCLDTWFASPQNRTCPMCRDRVFGGGGGRWRWRCGWWW